MHVSEDINFPRPPVNVEVPSSIIRQWCAEQMKAQLVCHGKEHKQAKCHRSELGVLHNQPDMCERMQPIS